MLRVKLGLDEVEVRFDHKWCNPDEIESITGVCTVAVDEIRRCTLATVNLNGKMVGKGMAICNPIDNFRKSTGRKRAMSDGLYALSRELRTVVWKAYEVELGF